MTPQEQLVEGLQRVYEEFYTHLYPLLGKDDAHKQARFLTEMLIARWVRQSLGKELY